ncbi:MAG: hypothetical protein ACC662_04900 [Planctomycetota bacterium]
MNSSSRSYALRLAVLAGGVVLLTGLVGFLLLVFGEGGARKAAPPMHRVRIEGQGAGRRIEVAIRFEENGRMRTVEARRTGEPGVWLLPPFPRNLAVTILVREAGSPAPRLLEVVELPTPPPEEFAVRVPPLPR